MVFAFLSLHFAPSIYWGAIHASIIAPLLWSLVGASTNVNLIVVKAHNEAKLVAYREMGVTRVGVEPESLTRKRIPVGIRDWNPGQPRNEHGEWTASGAAIGTLEFKAWFGNSKVVNADGSPKVVYHGTPAEFEAFDLEKTWLSSLGDSGGLGAFFTDQLSANHYAGKTGSVIPVYLSLRNPKVIEKISHEWDRMLNSKSSAGALRRDLIKQGFDGAITPLDEYVAFHPEQIKSAISNTGKFDPKKPGIRDAFDPSEPRNEQGEWTSGGSGALGHGYSREAELVGGTIRTSNVYDAVRALYENRKVELNQPRELTTLIDKLAKVAQHMIDRGGEAPDFNLCNVTVRTTNLFCADAKGIPRVKMPQLADAKAFRHHLENLGYTVTKEMERPSRLRATQSELNALKVAKMERTIRGEGKQERIVVSREGYILDGHHRWAAQVALDAADNKFDAEMRIARVDVGIAELLAEAHKYTGGKGAKGFADWNPDQPREPAGSPEGGEFAGGGVRTDYPMQSRTMIVPLQTREGPSLNVEVLVNPTFREVEQLAREAETTRLAFDKSNNVYAWSGYEVEHDRMLHALEKHIGQKILVNPRFEKVEREGDVPLYKLTTDPPSGIAALHFVHGKLVSSEHYAAGGDVAVGHAHALEMIARGQWNAKRAAAGAAAIAAGHLTVYHGTALEVADKIGREGITVQKVRSMGDPNTDGLYEGARGEDVFVTTDKKRAYQYAHGPESVVFEIHVPEAEWGSLP
jgi:ADP-Ribosyltransferase in polyvalent proteins/ParB-like nuclease domain